MTKYGVNWFLYSVAYLLMIGALGFWLRQVLEVAMPYKPGEHHLPWFIFGGFSACGHLWHKFSLLREKARTGDVSETPKTTRGRFFMPMALLGFASAFMGMILLVFPAWASQVGTGAVIGYAVGVPFFAALCAYLTELAEDAGAVSVARDMQRTENPSAMVANHADERLYHKATAEETVDDAQTVVLGRGR